MPTQLLQGETARSNDITSPIETARNIQTGKLKTTGEINAHRHGVALALSVLILVATAFGFWLFKVLSPSGASSPAPIESIAVLPFINESGHAEMEYLSDGMTESLINSLSQLPKLNVKARSSVFRYKGKQIEPQQIGNELEVQAVLNGRASNPSERSLAVACPESCLEGHFSLP